MLKISIDRREVDAMLRAYPGQARYAVSTAVNELLKLAQTEQRAHQRDVFQVRNPGFVDKAVKIKPFATKQALFGVISIDPPGGEARADILTKFEEGGRKTPRGGGSIAVPQGKKNPNRMRPSEMGFTMHGSSGKVWKGANRTFLVGGGSGGGVIYQRTGKGRVRSSNIKTRKTGFRGRRSGVKVLYALTPSAHIGRVLQFDATVTRSIGRHATAQMMAAWNKAVATAIR